MEENEGKDLAKDMKEDKQIQEKYYENVQLELSKIKLNNVMIEETKSIQENSEQEVVEYGVYIKFKGEDVKIATIDAKGNLIPNEAILQDARFQSDEDKKKLGDMLNLLGLEQEKVDVNKLQEQLKEVEAKTKEEIDKEREDEKKENTAEEEIAEDKEENKEDEEKDKKIDENTTEEDEKEQIAEKNIYLQVIYLY